MYMGVRTGYRVRRSLCEWT